MSLQSLVEAAFEDRAAIDASTTGDVRAAVAEALRQLDDGTARVAEKVPGGTGRDSWRTHQWLKKAVLLSFRLNDMAPITGGPGSSTWWDKVPSKFDGWGPEAFKAAGFRAVPGAIVRHAAYIAPNVILMPSFVNLGAYVDAGTMVDTWVTVGSCAQIGKNVHLSGGVGIGGVLEPLQANPTVIEDDCFIGARSEVVEGVIVGQGAVLSMGTFLSASTKIVDRATGAIHIGYVPPFSVVVPGNLPGKPLPDGTPGPSLYCAVIVKTVDAQTRAKTAINDLLRGLMAFLTASPAFLFKTDQGEIDAATWRRAAALLFAILVVATVLWRLLAPYARHDLATMAFFQPLVIVAYVYLIAFSFAVILTAICFTNLTAKRLRARRRPPALAGLLPLTCLFAGAGHWLQPRVGDDFPFATVLLLDGLVLAVAAWIVVECGVLGAARASDDGEIT